MLKRNQIYTSYMYSYPHKTAYQTLENLSFDSHKLQATNNLYFHIPFCETKCGYCNLFSVVNTNTGLHTSYIEAMKQQIEQYQLLNSPVKKWNSFTIGGGTPLLLSPSNLEALFSMTKELGINSDTYIGIETSPNQTTKDKLEILKKQHVDRISIGVQSFIDEELQALQRHHTVKKVKEALSLIKEMDFPCLNIDLIYGLHNQTIESIQYSLEQAVSYHPDEIFMYPLYVRHGTSLASKQKITHEQTYDFYLFIRDYLLTHGYQQLSMRRFVKEKPQQEIDCGFEDVISIGCGGRSYLGNLHFCTPYKINRTLCLKQIDEYIKDTDKTKITHGYILNDEEMKRRYVIKNLLYYQGIDKQKYLTTFNSDVIEDFTVFNELIEKKYCINTNERVYLTDLGISLSDYIGPMFISEQVFHDMKGFYD